jgi:hypothetical protein
MRWTFFDRAEMMNAGPSAGRSLWRSMTGQAMQFEKLFKTGNFSFAKKEFRA